MLGPVNCSSALFLLYLSVSHVQHLFLYFALSGSFPDLIIARTHAPTYKLLWPFAVPNGYTNHMKQHSQMAIVEQTLKCIKLF